MTTQNQQHSSPHHLVKVLALVVSFSALLMLRPTLGFAKDNSPPSHPSLAPMLERVNAAVVNVSTYTKRSAQTSPLFNDPFFRHFFDLPESYQQPGRKRSQAAGSGVIIDAEKGIVITNHHVVEGADEIEIGLTDGRTFLAERLGNDPEVDLAVLKIKADDLTAIPMADSDAQRVGDYVAAIGNPFGLGQTVTTGIISALGRSGLGIDSYEDFIQTDASINPGNSGGALVNLAGELIGINTAIIAPAGGNVGIGFAIPVNMAKSVTDQILEYGEVQRGQLGIIIQNLTRELAEAFNLEPNQKGVLVAEVKEDSPAEMGGLRPGDIITAIDGDKIETSSELRNNIGFRPIGERVAVTVIRDTRQRELRIKIGERNNVCSTQATNEQSPIVDKRLEGASLSNARRGRGVVVQGIDPGSAASYAGLRPGDLISMVNQQKISDLSDLRQALKRSKKQLLLRISRDGSMFYLVIQ